MAKMEQYQNWANVASIIFLSLTGVAGYLNYYFGEKIEGEKDLKQRTELANVRQEQIQHLEELTKDIKGYVIGKNGKALIDPLIEFHPYLRVIFGISNLGKYPVYDIYGEWSDMDEAKIETHKNIFQPPKHIFKVSDLHPNKAFLNVFEFDFRNRNELKLQVFLRYRAGQATQLVRVIKVNNIPLIAIRTYYENEVVEDNIPEGFPGYNGTNADQIFGIVR